MDDLQHIGYSREVIEFVAVAKEFCGYLEGSHEEDASELLSKLQKFIPLIYLKGSLLPSCESDNLGMMEEIVTEEDYISAYRSGMIDVIEEALWQLNNSFELYWGKACASVLRAIHLAIYKVVDTDDSM